MQTSDIKNKGDITRTKLIEVGAQLFHLQGYNNTGLQQILKKSGVVKGSFYFHFKDKEAFALAIIDHYQQLFKNNLKHHLANETLDASQKIEAFHRFHLCGLEGMNFKGGCPLGNFSLEMADISEPMANKLNRAFSGLSKCFQIVIEQGQKEQRFKADLDPKQMADFLINSWEGAVLRSKSDRNNGALENWFSFSQQLLKAT